MVDDSDMDQAKRLGRLLFPAKQNNAEFDRVQHERKQRIQRPPHDVMISYCSVNEATAAAVCSAIEERGIRCWIAPRDINPGEAYAGVIVDAIRSSKAIVLIFSRYADASKHVLTETSTAFDASIPILSLKIDDVIPSSNFEYYLRAVHWVDAMTPPMRLHIEAIVERVATLVTPE